MISHNLVAERHAPIFWIRSIAGNYIITDNTHWSCCCTESEPETVSDSYCAFQSILLVDAVASSLSRITIYNGHQSTCFTQQTYFGAEIKNEHEITCMWHAATAAAKIPIVLPINCF